MIEFGLALAVFLLSHAIPTRPGIRNRLIDRLGKPVYLAGYSVLSVCLLAWLISAAWRAPFVAVWDPQAWQAASAIVLVPIGMFFIFAGMLSANPLSAAFRTAGFDPERPGVVGLTRHPILWGFAFWGFAHTLANGDAVGLILFGTMTLFAIAGTWAVDRRMRRTLGAAEWERLSARTSNLPLAALTSGKGCYSLDAVQITAFAASAVVALLLLFAGGHEWLFGMDPTVWWS